MSDVRSTALPHARWSAEALWQQLEPLLPGLSVEVLARIESTNTELLSRARVGARADGSGGGRGRRSADLQPCLLVAEQQTRGRGRLGRDWRSSAEASLTFSLSLPLAPRAAGGWSGLSLAVGCALAGALEPATTAAPRLLLKWPNDLWLRDDRVAAGGRKLGGILIETAPVGDQRVAVIGIGLNVHPQPDEGLSHGLASVDELDPSASPPAVLARVAGPLVQALRRFEADGLAAFAADFARRDLLAGRTLRTEGANTLTGTGAGIDAEGALQIRDASGTLHRVASGEVSVRPC
jgi:BirA family transcriptional regulator, biotin operon repressor / biotin---[acetyl-CoA-carboxylase] ligase